MYKTINAITKEKYDIQSMPRRIFISLIVSFSTQCVIINIYVNRIISYTSLVIDCRPSTSVISMSCGVDKTTTRSTSLWPTCGWF